MYTLYTIPGTCSTGIAVLLEKLGVSYETIKRDDVPNYTDIVPTNQVPAIKTEDGRVIAEGGAIALYLLEKHGKDLLPSSVEERAAFYQWFNFDYATLHPAYSKLFTIAFKVELADDVKADLLQQLADKVSEIWTVLDKHLANRTFIVGDTPSHVDYMAAVYSSWGNFFPNTTITLGENVKRLIANVQALPEFQAGYAKDQAEFKAAA
ncbi:MAG: glutathione S-transferase family protein [Rickettsiales bacterium]|nr:glutathione S-transferase family protein [Rickettsiales bacterium]